MGRAKTGSRRARPEAPLQDRLMRAILPAGRSSDDYRVVDVANTSDTDQREMMRSKLTRADAIDTKTLRKRTRLEKLHTRGVIDADQLAACEWYAERHETGFLAGQRVTANYGEGGGGNARGHDHLARNIAQYHARRDFIRVKACIPIAHAAMFDAVVLNGASIAEASGDRNAGDEFRACAQTLYERVKDRLAR